MGILAACFGARMPQKQRRDTITVSIRLPRGVHAKLRKVTEERKQPLSEFITNATLAALVTCPTCGRDHEGERSLKPRSTSHVRRRP